MLITILVAQSLGTSLTEEQSKKSLCKSGNKDMTNSAYFMVAMTVVVALIFIVFFKPKYRRLDAEDGASNNTPVHVNDP